MKHGLKVFIEHYKSKEHWYIKYITWGIIGIVCFAILVHIFKELGFLPAQKIFDFFDDWAMVLSAAVMLLLAGAAVWAIMDNRHGRRVDRRERLLNEIIEWAIGIRTPSLDINIPVTDSKLTRPEIRRMEANVLFRYTIPFLKNEYIIAIARKTFKKELECDVENTINTLTAFIFLKGTSFGMQNVKESFGGTSLKIIEEVEKQINEGKKTIDQLLAEYAWELSTCTTVLLSKIGNIMASL